MSDRSSYYKQYYQKNKERKNEYSKEYLAKNKDKNSEACRRYYQKTRAARGHDYFQDEFERHVIESKNFNPEDIIKLHKKGWAARTIASFKNLRLSTVERILIGQ